MGLSFFSRRKLPTEQNYSSMPTPTPAPAPRQQQANFSSMTGRQMYVPPKVQTVNRPTTQPTTQAYNLASGMDSRYSSNPTNQVKPTNQQQQSSPYAAYLERMKALGQKQTAQKQARAAETAQVLGDTFDKTKAINEARKPALQNNFNQYKTNVQGQIANEQQALGEANDQTREFYGEALRRGAEANRSSMGQLQNVFANLGTVDSRAFQNMSMNQQSKFAGGQQSTLKEQARELAANSRNFTEFKQNAEMLISQEEANLNERLAQIDATIAKDSAEYQQAVRQAYAEAEDAVNQIEQGLLESEMGMAQVQQEQDIKAAANKPKSSATTDISNVVTQLLGVDTKPITGWMRMGGVIPGGEGQVAQGLYDQLIALLSLDNRQMLKGSGAISDYEAKVMERAASRIRPGMSDEDFRAALKELQQALGGTPAQTPMNNQYDPLGIL